MFFSFLNPRYKRQKRQLWSSQASVTNTFASAFSKTSQLMILIGAQIQTRLKLCYLSWGQESLARMNILQKLFKNHEQIAVDVI